jgi:epoxyqueuosine reductase QueG
MMGDAELVAEETQCITTFFGALRADVVAKIAAHGDFRIETLNPGEQAVDLQDFYGDSSVADSTGIAEPSGFRYPAIALRPEYVQPCTDTTVSYLMAHELGHEVLNFGLSDDEYAKAITPFNDASNTKSAVSTYALTNYDEFFAENVAAYWNAPDFFHSPNFSRQWQAANAPAEFKLLAQIFPGA